MAALGRHSLPTTDFSMLYDVGVVYGGLMFKAAGLEAWEDAGLLLVDTLYPDYWRSWSSYGDEWDAYEKVSRNVTSLPDRVVELIKVSTIFNSCTTAVELRFDHYWTIDNCDEDHAAAATSSSDSFVSFYTFPDIGPTIGAIR